MFGWSTLVRSNALIEKRSIFLLLLAIFVFFSVLLLCRYVRSLAGWLELNQKKTPCLRNSKVTRTQRKTRKISSCFVRLSVCELHFRVCFLARSLALDCFLVDCVSVRCACFYCERKTFMRFLSSSSTFFLSLFY